ncbi:Thioredoxin-like fold [Phytophthora cinnamomi]|uniref:Thioredoxin-like fold n=1 Tax=Phytophthora cinnamomi TaxID=4785 RepID=UPI0035596F07|nr:Thioredoxin-like fold [Phytophthora cinnamomi]
MAAPAQHAACGHAHDHAHPGEDHEDELDELDLAFDPTLASCCERDEHEYKKAMQLKAVLTAHDRTSGAVRMRQQLFQPPPSGAGPATQQSSVVAPQVPPPQVSDSESDSDDEFDDSDDEFGVQAMLAARRKQLEQQLHRAAQDAAEGYGVVLDAALPQLVQELQSEPEVPRVALVVDSPAAESPGFLRAMRGEMASVAQRFLGSKFYVVLAARDDDALRQLRLPSVPSLAAFRRGERVDSIVLDPTALVTEIEVLWEARFLPWLAKCSVLTSERQASQNSRSKASSKQAADQEDEMEREGFDCGVEGCRLRFGYEHEHVGTSQQTKDEIAAWRHA